MLIKSADDKSKRLKLLEDLQQSPWLDARQKAWLHDELWRLRRGLKGEQDAAHYINVYYGQDNHNWAVLHDVRLEVDGEVAQIDHLLIGRVMMILLETKNFSGNVSINEQGEFTVTYPGSGKSSGISSPLEQSRRHEKVLRKLLDRLDIKTRTGQPMEMHHVVLFHPQSIIERPLPKTFDTRNIIKADHLRTWHQGFADREVGVLKTLTLALNARSQDTVREWAEKIKRQHRPADPLELPDFIQPRQPLAPSPSAPALGAAPVARRRTPKPADKAASDCADRAVCATCGQALEADVQRYCQRHAARFGGKLYCRAHQPAASPAPASPPPAAPSPAPQTEAPAGAVCAECAKPLSSSVVDYCRQHAARFGGKLYCWVHQKARR